MAAIKKEKIKKRSNIGKKSLTVVFSIIAIVYVLPTAKSVSLRKLMA